MKQLLTEIRRIGGYQDAAIPPEAESSKPTSHKKLQGTKNEMHGRLGLAEWAPPTMVTECDQDARPGYVTRKAHEYLDDPDVLEAKLDLFVSLIKQSRQMVLYTGAGISTASGIGDYASSTDSIGATKRVVSAFDAQPTASHFAFTALHRAGYLKHWVQQNHDGLPQKAGFPQECLNEIHGAWYDPSNPVVKMAGDLRSDLFELLLDWTDRTDLCVAAGTSLCGMNADRIVTTVANKKKKKEFIGAVIVNLQQTQYDEICCLRIFAKIDDVTRKLLERLNLQIAPAPTFSDVREVVVPYDKDGNFCATESHTLSLQPNARVMITNGPHQSRLATVLPQTNREGHFKIQIDNQGVYILGRWWLEAATRGALPTIPIVSVKNK